MIMPISKRIKVRITDKPGRHNKNAHCGIEHIDPLPVPEPHGNADQYDHQRKEEQDLRHCKSQPVIPDKIAVNAAHPAHKCFGNDIGAPAHTLLYKLYFLTGIGTP